METVQRDGARRVPAPVRRLRAEDETRRAGRSTRRTSGPILTYADVYPGRTGARGGHRLRRRSRSRCARGRGRRRRGLLRGSRDEHRAQAVANLEDFFGKVPEALELRVGAVEDVPTRRAVRPVRPRPPRAVGARWRRSAEVLEPGGVVCAYLPTTIQVQELVLALAAQRVPPHRRPFEVLRRGWHVTERSVRPDHRMVAHTGFLTVAPAADPWRIVRARPGSGPKPSATPCRRYEVRNVPGHLARTRRRAGIDSGGAGEVTDGRPDASGTRSRRTSSVPR